MVEQNPENIQQIEGQILRDRANQLTEIRSTFSPILGLSVALDDGESLLHTMANTATSAYMEWTDYADGKYARRASELLDEETLPEGGEADHIADKKKFYSQVAGLIIRSLLHEKDPKQAMIIGANAVAQGIRDVEMHHTRKVALDNGVNANARNLGKYKTWANSIGNSLHTMSPAIPEKYRPTIKKIGNFSLSVGTVLSYAALIDMRSHVGAHKNAKEIVKTQPGETSPLRQELF